MSVGPRNFNVWTFPGPRFEPKENIPESEESWRLALQEVLVKLERYQAAAGRHKEVLHEQSEGSSPGPDSFDVRSDTRQAESVALAEYRQVLEIFIDLTSTVKPKE